LTNTVVSLDGNKLPISLQHNVMVPIKFLASQAHSVNQYKKIRMEVMKCRAIIYFTNTVVSLDGNKLPRWIHLIRNM